MGVSQGRVPQNLYKPITIHHPLPQIPNPSRYNFSTCPPWHARAPTTAPPSTTQALPSCVYVYHVNLTWQKDHRPYFEEEERSNVIFGSYREDQTPLYLVSLRTRGRTLSDTSSPTLRALLSTDPWDLFFGIIEPTYLELTLELCSTFHFQIVMTEFDDPRTVQFHLSGLVRQLSVPEFGTTLGLYTEEFMDDNELDTLHRHIHYSPLKC
ncbi:hypothetical protein GOBAR_AA32519 [Gossypium barbadense]|uniref:Uncharacterized protein n=1 Tax=Gossypium barbadense TaxID=3634 RepID=A0A2P5WAQ5_GOSBA|nr:hypothetical protein GOBAR_AA32519 [Gossypium barbadense]